jgi:hypothetical protein
VSLKVDNICRVGSICFVVTMRFSQSLHRHRTTLRRNVKHTTMQYARHRALPIRISNCGDTGHCLLVVVGDRRHYLRLAVVDPGHYLRVTVGDPGHHLCEAVGNPGHYLLVAVAVSGHYLRVAVGDPGHYL